MSKEGVVCPHCNKEETDRDRIYKMITGFNVFYDIAELNCPSCGKPFRCSYIVYYGILDSLRNGK